MIIIVTDNIFDNSYYALWCLHFSYIVAMVVTLVTD